MRGRGPGFGEVLGIREFRALWAAELFSILGDQLARVALAILVFQRTSSAALSALTYALTFAPAIIGGALLSGLADRYPRRRVMIITDLLRAALAASMAIPSLPLPALWVLVGALSMASAPFKAAQLALLPQILDGDRYVTGVSLRQITGQSAQLVGFATGGLLLAAIEPHIALAANAATFLISAGLIVTGVRQRPAAAHGPDPATPSGPAAGERRGILPLFILVSVAGLYVVPEGIAAPYGAAINVGAAGVGLLMAADPLGSVIGAWLVAHTRIKATPSIIVAMAAASGVPLLLCAPGPGLAISITLWALSGALSTAYLIQCQAIIVTLVPDHRRGRVMGRLATCLYASSGLAIVGGGVAAQVSGPFRSVAATGLLGIVIALCVGAWWRRVVRSRRDLVAGSAQHSNVESSSHQMSLLAITDTSSRVDCRSEQEKNSGQMSLLHIPDVSSQAVGMEKNANQMSLLRIAGSSQTANSIDNHSDQMSLLATASSSTQSDPEHEYENNRHQMSLLGTTATSTHLGLQQEKHCDQMSLLGTAGTSTRLGLEQEKHRGQMSLLATTATSTHRELELERLRGQMSLLGTTGTSTHLGLELGKHRDQMSLLATTGTSAQPGPEDEQEYDGHQMSLLGTTGTSAARADHEWEIRSNQMSLLGTMSTSSARAEHQLEWEIRSNQMSLLATTSTSSMRNVRQHKGKKTEDQMSLLAITGTSFRADCRTMRKAGLFLKWYAGRRIVDWGRKRPHYGGAFG
jgi:MFS family permease